MAHQESQNLLDLAGCRYRRLGQALTALGYPDDILTVDEFMSMNNLVSTTNSSEGV